MRVSWSSGSPRKRGNSCRNLGSGLLIQLLMCGGIWRLVAGIFGSVMGFLAVVYGWYGVRAVQTGNCWFANWGDLLFDGASVT